MGLEIVIEAVGAQTRNNDPLHSWYMVIGYP